MKIQKDLTNHLRAGCSRVPSIAVLTILFCALFTAGRVQAQVSISPLATVGAPINIACTTGTTGPAPGVAITVKPVTSLVSPNTLAVSLGTLPAGIVVTPTTGTLTAANQVAGIVFTVRAAPGCSGATAGTNLPVNFRFNYGSSATPGSTVNIAYTVNATATPLTPSPSSVSLSCTLSGSTYTLGAAQTVSVTSGITLANGGTPFTVSTAANASGSGAAWAIVNPKTGLNANATTPVSLTVTPSSNCGGFAAGSTNTTTITLLNAPAPARVISVTLRVFPPTNLLATPSSASLTYVKGSGSAGRADVTISATAGTPFFAIDTTSLPIWLTVDAVNGTTPRSLRFSSTSVADSLAAGTYNATVRLRVANFGDLSVPVSLSVNNPAPKLSISEGTNRNISWIVGQAVPSLLITAVSSDSPIPYTLTTGGKLAPVIAASQQSGLAYSFGTSIPVTFDQLTFAAATPGSVLTGTVAISWGSPAQTVVVTINVSIQSAGATVSGISPAGLPTAPVGTSFTAVLTGSNFITGTNPALRTKVGIVTGGTVVPNTNITSTVVNGSNIILTFIVPTVADAALPFAPSGNGGNVVIGICNPVNGVCTTPSGTATLTIGSNPIVQAVTSASAYVQVNPPALQTIAPYDMISIFGTNFCSSGGSGCSSSQVLYGAADPLTLTYPKSISPDLPGPTQRLATVTFQTQGSTPTEIATAPILFATNNQINAMVPAAVGATARDLDIVVSFGYGTATTTLRKSAPMGVTIAATNPGLFTIGSNGQGEGAVLDSTWAVISASNPAAVRRNVSGPSGGTSDSIQLYLTGLGIPDSIGSNATASSNPNPVWGADCVSIQTFLDTLSGFANLSPALAEVDGTIVQSSMINTGRLVPCIVPASAPTITIGGRAATVTYAGFVPDSIAGLYQINAKLPINGDADFTDMAGATISTLTVPVELPVIVTAGGRSSQPGVSLWVTPRLQVDAPSGAGLTGTVAVPWSSSSNAVVATQGTPPYRYALSSGLLPAGLTFNTSTGAITGTPVANTSGTYLVTATATDSANAPLRGSVSFTVTVAGGLFLSMTGSSPLTGTFGTANSTLTTVSGAGGLFPYTYAITAPSSLPTGMTIGASTGVIAITAVTPAGNYPITVTGSDAAVPQVAGSVSFSLNHALLMTGANSASAAFGVASNVRTITATGGTSTITYSTPTTGFTVNSSGVVNYSGSLAAGTYDVIVNATDTGTAAGATGFATGTITISVVVAP